MLRKLQHVHVPCMLQLIIGVPANGSCLQLSRSAPARHRPTADCDDTSGRRYQLTNQIRSQMTICTRDSCAHSATTRHTTSSATPPSIAALPPRDESLRTPTKYTPSESNSQDKSL